MILWIILTISLLTNVGLGYVVVRGAFRLIQFDDLFELLVHDLETNVKYFEKLTNSPLLSNSPEILDAQRNMKIVKDRLDEYITRMEDLSKRRLRRQLTNK